MSAGAAMAGAAVNAAAGRDALTGANAALNEVQNNRLLHRTEQVKLSSLVSRWQELGYASEEQARARLEIAACGMTLCAEPTDKPRQFRTWEPRPGSSAIGSCSPERTPHAAHAISSTTTS
jgi:hypothetical protein